MSAVQDWARAAAPDWTDAQSFVLSRNGLEADVNAHWEAMDEAVQADGMGGYGLINFWHRLTGSEK